MKAIETYYNGYKFRSRLEARWAVFFNEMGIRYEYEPEGFEEEDEKGHKIMYLPDFYLPESKLYAEVKGTTYRGGIPKKDAIKMAQMIKSTDICPNGIILLGDIPCPDECGEMDMIWAIWKHNGKGLVCGYEMCKYPTGDLKNFLDFEYTGNYFEPNDDLALTGCITFEYPDELYSVENKVSKALKAARQARFEHGEN